MNLFVNPSDVRDMLEFISDCRKARVGLTRRGDHVFTCTAESARSEAGDMLQRIEDFLNGVSDHVDSFEPVTIVDEYLFCERMYQHIVDTKIERGSWDASELDDASESEVMRFVMARPDLSIEDAADIFWDCYMDAHTSVGDPNDPRTIPEWEFSPLQFKCAIRKQYDERQLAS